MRNTGFFTTLCYAARFFFGGWFLFHGANYWLHYFPEPSFAPGAHGFIPELIKLHIFDIVKVLEVVIGLMLLADLFVPLAIVAAVPISLVIAQLNFMKHDMFGTCVGLIIIALNGIMALGYLDRYLPMLAMRAGTPGSAGIKAWSSGDPQPPLSTQRMRPMTHIAAILLGIAAPATVTYLSIALAHPKPGATHP